MKDVNLALLLIPDLQTEGLIQRSMTYGNEVFPMKPIADARLQRTLTFNEFSKAFTIYKGVMCEVYPARREEFDGYMSIIVDMVTQFKSQGFYAYHKAFSRKAANQYLNYDMKLDWSIRDEYLFNSVFAGVKANVCEICASFDHSTSFCPQAITSKKQPAVKNLCRPFNGKGCTYQGCRFLHECKKCSSVEHGALTCPQAAQPASYQPPHQPTKRDTSSYQPKN